jgi:hypothetical protein
MSQKLDAGRARGLCPKNVSTFYKNLEYMLQQGYELSYIWNYDKSRVQAGRNGGGRDLAKKGMRSIHSIILKEREWLSVLVYINAADYHISKFYIFHSKSFQRDYIKNRIVTLDVFRENHVRKTSSKHVWTSVCNSQ